MENTEKNDIEKAYNHLCKKYSLPKFEEIDKEFEISALESQRFLIKGILKRISETLEPYAESIGNLVHPDGSSLITMHEVRFFSEDEKNEMYTLFKKFMKTGRHISELILANDEKEQAIFLSNFFSEWLAIKKNLRAYLGKMKECWENESTIDDDLGYLG